VTEPRTVLVTGGSRGIGGAIAAAFHGAGAHVLIVARRETEFAATLGERARFFAGDVRHPGSLRDAVSDALSWTGRLDVLVNGAGVSAWRPLARIDEAFWQDMIDTNLSSVVFASQAAAPHLEGGGCIINVSSLAGKRGSANNSAYCAAKFGVNGVTQALAKELGPQGIRVNAVCPVYVRTAGLDEALATDESPAGGADIGEYLSGFAATQAALGTLPTAEQVAAACLFLSSPAAGAVTGQCINVDCGVLPS
jgi:NAD(P)-dependent dehydrogenase (short-subunit alcohol dehydrogenase family)